MLIYFENKTNLQIWGKKENLLFLIHRIFFLTLKYTRMLQLLYSDHIFNRLIEPSRIFPSKINFVTYLNRRVLPFLTSYLIPTFHKDRVCTPLVHPMLSCNYLLSIVLHSWLQSCKINVLNTILLRFHFAVLT